MEWYTEELEYKLDKQYAKAHELENKVFEMREQIDRLVMALEDTEFLLRKSLSTGHIEPQMVGSVTRSTEDARRIIKMVKESKQ